MPVKLTETRYGKTLYLDKDNYFRVLLEQFGEYSENEVDLFRQLLRDGDKVIDGGANIGMHSMALSEIVGPKGAVLAFEPQLPIYYILCGNIALGERWNVFAYPYALGARQGNTKIPFVDYDQINSFGGVTTGGFFGHDVPLVPIDHFNISDLKLIKLDIEGAEIEALHGARETIARCRPFLYVENDRIENSRALLSLMFEMKYRLFWHTARLCRPDNFRGMTREDNGLPDDLFNIVAVMVLGMPSEMDIGRVDLKEIISPDDKLDFDIFDTKQLNDF